MQYLIKWKLALSGLLAVGVLYGQPLPTGHEAITGLVLPTPPSVAELRLREQALADKDKQLKSAEQAYEKAKLALIEGKLLKLGVPKLAAAAQDAALQKRAYPGFLVGFSAEHGQPQWSYHAIERDIFRVCLAREEAFFEDLSLTGAPRLSQYRSSGFDRGHMAPAADFRWSPTASVASNTLTNISPQVSNLNAGLWENLEISTRHYLEVRDSLDDLLVVTGPVLESGLKKLKDTTRISIPKKFFKVVVNLKEQRGFAFLMEATAPKVDFDKAEPELRKRAMPIDSLEKMLRIDFFPSFSAAQHKNIEGKIDLDDWFSIPGTSIGNAPPIADPVQLATAFNTVQITAQNRLDKKAVVGTVVQINAGASGGFGLLLDSLPPHNRFQILVQARDVDKFKTPALPELLGKVVRAEGTITVEGDRFRMGIRDAKKLIVLK